MGGLCWAGIRSFVRGYIYTLGSEIGCTLEGSIAEACLLSSYTVGLAYL